MHIYQDNCSQILVWVSFLLVSLLQKFISDISICSFSFFGSIRLLSKVSTKTENLDENLFCTVLLLFFSFLRISWSEGSKVLSFHPLCGPDVSFARQRHILIFTFSSDNFLVS